MPSRWRKTGPRANKPAGLVEGARGCGIACISSRCPFLRAMAARNANKLTVHILAAVAQHEREMISERTKDALQAAKAASGQSQSGKRAQASPRSQWCGRRSLRGQYPADYRADTEKRHQ